MSPSNLPETWKMPEELCGPVPRRVRATPAAAALFFLALGLMAFGIILGRFSFDQSRAQASWASRMAAEGQVTEAVVSRLSHAKSYYVEYKFILGNWEYRGSVTVDPQYWESLRFGSRIGVRYLPSDPMNNCLSSSPLSVPTLRASVTNASLPVVFFGGLGCLTLVSLWGAVRFVAHARAVAATITGFETGRSRSGTITTVFYEFPVEGTESQRGKYTLVPGLEPPAAGSLICVLYHPKNPKRSQIYDDCLVTAAPPRH
jgi:hypothetical protein